MPNLRKSHAFFLIIIALLVVFIGFVNAAAANLTVQRGKEVDYPISLSVDDRVLIQFTDVGGNVNTLHFSMIFPNATVLDFGEVGDFRYSFISDADGEYILHFANGDLAESKFVTLGYEVDHYVFGMPQMLFLTIIIALVCIVGIIAFVFMGRKA